MNSEMIIFLEEKNETIIEAIDLIDDKILHLES